MLSLELARVLGPSSGFVREQPLVVFVREYSVVVVPLHLVEGMVGMEGGLGVLQNFVN